MAGATGMYYACQRSHLGCPQIFFVPSNQRIWNATRVWVYLCPYSRDTYCLHLNIYTAPNKTKPSCHFVDIWIRMISSSPSSHLIVDQILDGGVDRDFGAVQMYNYSVFINTNENGFITLKT